MPFERIRSRRSDIGIRPLARLRDLHLNIIGDRADTCDPLGNLLRRPAVGEMRH